MPLSEIFARRPIGGSLLALGIILLGAVAYRQLPVALLPAVDLPTLSVSVSLPGASPKVIATTVAAPLERQLGRIAGVTDLTSFSGFGFTSIVLQFELGHDIDVATRDAQAAINAAAKELPEDLPGPPTLGKDNPAMAPLLNLALTSDTLPPEKVFDFAKTVLAQKLSQVEGVAGVDIDGAEKSAIRVRVNPASMASLGLGLDDLRTAIAEASVDLPKGSFDGPAHAAVIAARNPRFDAAAYRSLVVAHLEGAAVRLGDIATVTSGSANTRAGGWFNDRPAVFVVVMRQPGANLVDTVDRVRAVLPQLKSWMPPGIEVSVFSDRSATVRAAVAHVQATIAVTIALVVLVIFLFLRRFWATAIPSVAIPVSLAGTIGVMYLLGYSLDALSLMALTVSVGFVVDDSIVMVETVVRHREAGHRALRAALLGVRQIGLTIVSITASLLAALIPLFFLPDIIGSFMKEFATTLGTAIVISSVASLTLVPALCGRLLSDSGDAVAVRANFGGRSDFFTRLLNGYGTSLLWVLRHRGSVLIVTLLSCSATIALYFLVPKGFIPPQDAGVIGGSIEGAKEASPAVRIGHMREVSRIILSDPAVKNVGSAITASENWLYVDLKPWKGRKATTAEVADRLKMRLAQLPGVTTHLQPVQDFWISGRQGYAQYQYTLQGEDWDQVSRWAIILRDKLRQLPELKDVDTYEEERALEAELQIDRDQAAQLGISPRRISDTLYDAFGQRQIAMLPGAVDQFPIVLEVDTESRGLGALARIFVKSAGGDQVPLRASTRAELGTAALSIPHRAQLPYVTLSFDLGPGVALSQAVARIRRVEAEVQLPAGLRSSFDGSAAAFQSFAGSQPILFLAAILIVYIVLGVLYESYVHPLTVLSTLPPAGLGALLALLACGLELSLIAFIGIILLIGIVAKNAIMMIDFALDAERQDALTPEEAIFQACLLRFRPIIMTTIAAALGSLPLALGTGPGLELRQPLGITVAAGLLFSQVLTLYTTPVVYLYLGRLHRKLRG
jgi:hydrophobe/amphiphile efflux-1 (HAE1) family protein